MKTKQMLTQATSENAAEVIRVATTVRGWSPEAVIRHGNAAVKTLLGKATANTVAVAPVRTRKAQPKPRPQANFSQAKPVSFTADFTPYRGGEAVREFVKGQTNVIGARGAQQALLTSESGKRFRLSARSFDRLVNQKERVLAWPIGGGTSVYITLA